MLELEPSRNRASDDQRALVQRDVVSAAERDQVALDMLSALRSRLDVVNIYERRVRTTRHPAAVPVSPEHAPPNRWRYILHRARTARSCKLHRARRSWPRCGAILYRKCVGRSSRPAHVGDPDPLRIAARHLR